MNPYTELYKTSLFIFRVEAIMLFSFVQFLLNPRSEEEKNRGPELSKIYISVFKFLFLERIGKSINKRRDYNN